MSADLIPVNHWHRPTEYVFVYMWKIRFLTLRWLHHHEPWQPVELRACVSYIEWEGSPCYYFLWNNCSLGVFWGFSGRKRGAGRRNFWWEITVFVDMAANQTRLGSANISWATFTHQRTFFTHGKTNSRSMESIWNYDCLSNVWPNQQYEMGGSGGGIFNFFYLWKIWNLLAWGLFRCFANVRGAGKEGKRVMACRTMSNDKDCLRMEVVWPQTTTEQADVEALPPRG